MAWEPSVGKTVNAHQGTQHEVTGRIVEDFGDFTPRSVVVNDTRIADAARRWAVLTDDGSLLFVDTEQLAPPAEAGAERTADHQSKPEHPNDQQDPDNSSSSL